MNGIAAAAGLLALVMRFLLGPAGIVRRSTDGEFRLYPWTKEVFYDANGKEIAHRWIKEPLPVVFKTAGLSHVSEYARRMAAFKGHDCSILISSLNGQHALAVMKMEGETEINLGFPAKDGPKTEARARHFFAVHGLPVIEDDVVPFGTQRELSWRLPMSASGISKIIQMVAVEFSGMSESEALSIQYQEHKFQEAPGPPGSSVSFETATRAPVPGPQSPH